MIPPMWYSFWFTTSVRSLQLEGEFDRWERTCYFRKPQRNEFHVNTAGPAQGEVPLHLPHETLCASVRNDCRATDSLHPGGRGSNNVIWHTQGTQMQEETVWRLLASSLLQRDGKTTTWADLPQPGGPWTLPGSLHPRKLRWSSPKCLHPGPSSWGS